VYGGAFKTASFVRQHLILDYGTVDLGSPGAHFMIADHVDYPSCNTDSQDNASWLASQGEMVSAWSEMAIADRDYCTKFPACTIAPSYYNSLADELADSVIYDQLNKYTGFWPFEFNASGALNLGQQEPTVDLNGILSEPCLSATWPSGCGLDPYPNYTIYKGLFEMGSYCLTHKAVSPVSDSTLTEFISNNANSIAGLDNFGFEWDLSGPNSPVNFGTRTSVLDGLDAQIGGSSAMC
jgi:hypothetical protein